MLEMPAALVASVVRAASSGPVGTNWVVDAPLSEPPNAPAVEPGVEPGIANDP
jgi:hypothetical protein